MPLSLKIILKYKQKLTVYLSILSEGIAIISYFIKSFPIVLFEQLSLR